MGERDKETSMLEWHINWLLPALVQMRARNQIRKPLVHGPTL